MEKVLKPYDKEYMRMAMLKHEETFREQVYELHRLYRMQKILMDRNGVSQHQQKPKQERYLVENNKTFTIDHQQQAQRNNVIRLERPENPMRSAKADAQEHIAESNSKAMLDEGEIELTLTLGPSTHNPRLRRMESGHESLSSSSTGSTQTMKTSPKNSSPSRGEQLLWGNNNFPQTEHVSYSNGQPSNSPWLLQTLSLNLTN